MIFQSFFQHPSFINSLQRMNVTRLQTRIRKYMQTFQILMISDQFNETIVHLYPKGSFAKRNVVNIKTYFIKISPFSTLFFISSMQAATLVTQTHTDTK